ncbi:hypothetical protein FCIRC_7887 [Fusarium circinatum]|uniref:Uncharacterized protein n=1 Tax=Fusarium circinatum TaxID=48490 RepID=A0A8H5WXQ6_FUSCI|nr:hypothetical protein FCIRC_7887 [Fusarium circinatum]
MSRLFVLIHILKGNVLRRCLSKRLNADDVAFLVSFSRILIGHDNCPDEISKALEKGIELEWEDVCDVVNPFGDTRGRAFNSVWTFDLDKDVLFLTKDDLLCSAPLSLARDRQLNMEDFEMIKLPTEATVEEKITPEQYWDLQPKFDPRKKTFLGRILRDFGHTWRHILRREANNVTFMKLAYAVIWIINRDFTIVERTGFDHVAGRGGPYVGMADLPRWDAPDETVVRVGTCWFVLARDIPKGKEMIREHMETMAAMTDSTTTVATYAILTLKQIVCCKVHNGELALTRREPLFSGTPPSEAAINLILWASDLHQAEPKACRLNYLPVEIQGRILRQATGSSVAAAKLSIELASGPPFSWAEGRRKIRLDEVLRHRTEASPVESQIFLNGVMSGLSYKCEAPRIGFKVDMSSLRAPTRLEAAVPSS